MKKFFVLITLLAAFLQVKAISIETSSIDCAGAGVIETEVEECGDNEYLIGLRLIQDSTGNQQYFLRLKIVGEKHVIARGRKALIKFDPKANIANIELAAMQQFSETLRKKTFKYRMAKGLSVGMLASAEHTAAVMANYDEDEKYEDDPVSNTYYPISEQQLNTLISNNVIKLRFDTSIKLLDIDCSKKLSSLLKEAKEEIQKVLDKDVYKDF